MRRAGQRCLVLEQEVLNYQEAREHCHHLGLELITLDTEEEVEEVRRLVELQQRSGCGEAQGWWVQDLTQSDGHHSLLRMSDCSLAIPQTERAVSDRPETDWDCSNTNFTLVSNNNDSLTATRHVKPRTVCQLPRQDVEDNEVITDVEELIEQEPEPECGGDWTMIGSSCYQTVSLRKTVSRDQAQVICRDRGGDLTEINSEEEHSALVDYYSHTFPLAASVGHLFSSFLSSLVPIPRRQKGWWLGGSYEDSSQAWSWDSQPEAEMAFTHWHPLNSHNNQTEDCLVLLDSRTLTWLTLPCSGREDGSLVLQPFCEKPLE